MANKQYISIIRLFNYCDISTDRDFVLQRAKKQLQAEFAIAQNGFLEIDRYVYTKHDVFEELDRTDFKTRLDFHKQIWNTPPMLNLLEDNDIDLSTIRDAFRPFWNNLDFDKFFSPYFSTPFLYFSRTLLAENRLGEMGEFLPYEGFLQAEEREEAFRPLRIFLDENLRMLRNTNAENYKMMRPKMMHWIDEDWHLLFNNLPAEFYEIKVDLTVRLINLGVAIQHQYKKDCRKMSDQLVSLEDIPEHINQKIVNNHKAYSGPKVRFNFRGYSWIIWVMIILIRAFANGCNDTNDNFNFQNAPINYQLDSVVRILKDSSKKISKDSILSDKSFYKQVH